MNSSEYSARFSKSPKRNLVTQSNQRQCETNKIENIIEEKALTNGCSAILPALCHVWEVDLAEYLSRRQRERSAVTISKKS
jgi:hypothetical protein